MEKVYRSTADIDSDKQFYINLGYTSEQADILARYVFGIEYTDKKQDIQDKYFLRGIRGFVPQQSYGLFMSKSVSSNSFALRQLEPELEYGFVEEIAEYTLKNNFEHEKYIPVHEFGYRDTTKSPLSTFNGTVSTASMSTIRDRLHSKKQIEKSMVKTEEMLNFFDYDIDARFIGDSKFYIHSEMSNNPSNPSESLLLVGIKGLTIDRPRQNIVLLVDVSGSMRSSNEKAISLQKSIMTIVKQLNTGDVLSIVTYSTYDTVLNQGLVINDDSIDTIINSIIHMPIEGCTNGSDGINTAYRLSEKYFLKEGSNRVILLTDGDFNFNIVDADGLENLILKKKESGSFLTTLGFGSDVYDEERLEILARNGNGVHFRITDDIDIMEVLYKNFNANTLAIAKDLKIQVEFNPAVVAQYRLVGYETRSLNAEDFDNDKVWAEQIGSGHTVVAMYQLVFRTDADSIGNNVETRYSKTSYSNTSEVGVVHVKYKEPFVDCDSSIEQTKVIEMLPLEMSNNMRIAYSVLVLAEYLRKSEFSKPGDILKAIETLNNGGTEFISKEKVKMLFSLLESC